MSSLVVTHAGPGWYFKLIWLLMPLSAIVFIEPSPYDLFVLVALAIGVLCSFVSFPSYSGLPLILLGVFLVSNLVPAVWSAYNPSLAVKYLAITLYLVFSWVFVIGLLNRYQVKALEVLFSGYVAAALFSAIIGALAYFQIIPSFGILTKYERATGLFKDPNVFGPFLVPAVIIALHKISTNKGRSTLVWAIIFTIVLLGVLLSFSRAAWGNGLIAIATYLLFPHVLSLRKRLLALLMLVFIALPVIGYFITSPHVEGLFTDRLGMKKYDEDRFSTQREALEKVTIHPLGIGPGQSEIVFAYATHSLYVRVISEYGFIGSTVFFTFLLVTFFRAFRNIYRRDGRYNAYFVIFFVVLLGLMFNSFFVDTLHWRHFWLLLAFPWMPNPQAIDPRLSHLEKVSGT